MMTPFARRIRRNLTEIADSAKHSEVAWNQIVARLDQPQADQPPDLISIDHTAEGSGARSQRRPGLVVLVMAAAAIVVAMLVVTPPLTDLTNDDESLTSSAGSTEDTDDPVARSDLEEQFSRYLDAGFVNHDLDRTMALFSAQAELAADNASIGGSYGRPTLDQWAAYLAWHNGQGSRAETLECQVTSWTKTTATGRCVWRLQDAVSDALDEPGITVLSEVTISEGLIASMSETLFHQGGSQNEFVFWMMQNHRDQGELFVDWSTTLPRGQARDRGAAYAQLARQWAADG